MYGTVMIGRMADGVSIDDYRKLSEEWRAQQGPSVGFVDEWALLADDGRIVVPVRFRSKDEYVKLSDDPGQDDWYTNKLRPLLAEDPEWIDGDWIYDSNAT